MIKTITINRRSKLGFAWTSCTAQDKKGNLYVPSPTEPQEIGTYNQICKAIDNDLTFKSVKSGGTYCSTAWFVKYEGKWYDVKYDWGYNPIHNLTWDYLVDIEIEE